MNVELFLYTKDGESTCLWSTWMESRRVFIMNIHIIFVFFLEPMFVDAHVIPDGTDPNDAKVYFFFKEKLADNSRSTKQIHSMTARICPVSVKVVLI